MKIILQYIDIIRKNQEIRESLILILFSFLYLYPFVRVLWRVGDEGSLVYGAQLVAEGALPYKNFFEVMGPGSFFWLGIFFKIFGTHFIVARGLLIFTGVTITYLLFWMTKRIYRGPFSALPSIFFLLVAIPIWPATNHHWDSDLFGLCAVGSFFLWQDKKTMRFLFVTGILSGITSCFIQQKGLLLILAFLSVIMIQAIFDKIRWIVILSRVFVMMAGYALIGVAVLLYFYMAGGLQDLIYDTVIFPATSYYNINKLPYGYGLFEFQFSSYKNFFGNILPRIYSNILSTVLLLPLIIVVYLPFIIISCVLFAIWNTDSRQKIFNRRIFPYWTAGFAFYISELHRKDAFHLIYGAPLMLILLFIVINYAPNNVIRVKKAILNIMVFCLVLFGCFNMMKALSADYQQRSRVGTFYSFKQDTALTFLTNEVAENEMVFVYPYYPMYYFLAKVKNPTRFNVLLPFPKSEEAFREAVSELENNKVKYVFWDTFVEGDNLKQWFPSYHNPPEEKKLLEKYLNEKYREIKIENGWRILIRHGDHK